MKNIYVKQNIVINLPIEVIFAYLSNLEHLIHWSSATLSVKMISPGVMRLGARAKIVIRFLGQQSEIILETVECQPGRSLMLKSTSSVTPCTFFFQFESLEEGITSISQDALFSFIGNFTCTTERIVTNAVHRQMEYDLLTLKDMLELYVPCSCSSIGT